MLKRLFFTVGAFALLGIFYFTYLNNKSVSKVKPNVSDHPSDQTSSRFHKQVQNKEVKELSTYFAKDDTKKHKVQRQPSATPAWKFVEVSESKQQAWLKRLDEPNGLVASYKPVQIPDASFMVKGAPKKEMIFDDNSVPVPEIAIELPTGETLIAKNERLDLHSKEMATWSGIIPGKPFSDVFFTYVGGAVHGHIQFESSTYDVQYGEGDIFLVRRLNIDSLPLNSNDALDAETGEKVENHRDSQSHNSNTNNTLPEIDSEIEAASDTSKLTIIVGYNTDAKNEAGGTNQIKATIGTAVSGIQTGFNRGNIGKQVQLVHTVEFGFVQTSSMSSDLWAFRNNGDSKMDAIHNLREQYKADLASVVFGDPAGGACGVGYLLRKQGGNPPSLATRKTTGFQATARDCIGGHTFAHEVGHNLGNHHNPEVTNGSHGYETYSHGHQVQSKGYRTIMAYSCSGCTRVLYFSNPNVGYNGAPTGTAAKDNVRSMKTTVPLMVQLFEDSAPSVTLSPSSVSKNEGQSFSLTASVSGFPVPTIKWYKNNIQFTPSATNGRSHTVSSATSGHSGTYKVVVTNTVGSATSNSAQVTITQAQSAPTIAQNTPANRVVLKGEILSLSVSASGNPAPSYQWYKGNTALSGQTSNSLRINNMQAGNAGIYKVRVRNSKGTVWSNNTNVMVEWAPTFMSSSPTNRNISRATGSNLVMSANFSASPTPTYQWYKSNQLLTGKTTNTFSKSAIAIADAGTYKVKATNKHGNVFSANFEVTIGNAPTITLQPQGQTLKEGETLSLTSEATGDPAPTFQWQRNGINLAGQTNKNLSIGSIIRNQGGSYRVRVSNGAGSTISNAVNVNVLFAPSITGGLGSRVVNLRDRVDMSITATGNPTPTFQWFVNDVAISRNGGNTANLSIPSVDWKDRGTYYVRIQNSIGSVETSKEELRINAVDRQPAGEIPGEGQSHGKLDRTGGIYGN